MAFANLRKTSHMLDNIVLLVTGAGSGIGRPSARTADYPLDRWGQVLRVNLSGVFYGMKYQIAAMLRMGGGAIVNGASILGAVGFATAPAYTAAKPGVIGRTRTAAPEYAAEGIRINAIGPGLISASMIQALDEDPAVASSRSSFVTGSYYPVDGGYLAC